MKNLCLVLFLLQTLASFGQENLKPSVTKDSLSGSKPVNYLNASLGLDMGYNHPLQSGHFRQSPVAVSSGGLSYKFNIFFWSRHGFGLGGNVGFIKQFYQYTSPEIYTINKNIQDVIHERNITIYSLGPGYYVKGKKIMLKAYIHPMLAVTGAENLSLDSASYTRTTNSGFPTQTEKVETSIYLASDKSRMYGALLGLNLEFKIARSLWFRSGFEYGTYAGKIPVQTIRNQRIVTANLTEYKPGPKTEKDELRKNSFLNFSWGLVLNLEAPPREKKTRIR